MKLIRYESPLDTMLDPVYSLAELRSEMDRLFDFAFPSLNRFSHTSGWIHPRCPIDLYRQGDHYILRAELPGTKKDEISLEAVNGSLVLNGHCRQIIKGNQGEKESSETRFSRTVALPADVDTSKITARYEDGVLEITLPQKEEVKPKQINIEVV